MAFFQKHIAQLPRLFDAAPKVQTIGHNTHKTKSISFAHPTLNFSFILRGGGELVMSGKKWKVTAPCVITQWPGVHAAYGPTFPWDFWDELFVVYHPKSVNQLQKYGFISIDKPVWEIKDIREFSRHQQKLKKLIQEPITDKKADRIDHCAINMIMDSLSPVECTPTNNSELVIRKVQSYLDQNFQKKVDFEELAGTNGMSYTSFRRHWVLLTNYSPAQYVINLRLQEARRLLVESNMNIGKIAYNVGFNDPLYFSRIFKKLFSISPKQYRKFHQYKTSVE